MALLRRPKVIATFAMTLDGKITSRNFTPVDFTSRADKAHLIEQRARGDAVMIGHVTLKKDNVRLGIARSDLRNQRSKRGQAPYPLRVIVSNEGRINHRLNIFQTDPAAAGPILIFSTTQMPRAVRVALMDRATLHLAKGKEVDLPDALHRLYSEYRIRTLAFEGGANLFRALLEHDLVDELSLTIAPFVFGGRDAPTLTGIDKTFLPQTVRCTLTNTRVVGDECFLTYRIKHHRRVRGKTRKGGAVQRTARSRKFARAAPAAAGKL